MKKSLLFITGIAIIMLSGSVPQLNGQTLLLSEDFLGFASGTHVSPSTSDASLSLDVKTSVPGWSGSFIYSAGGEIKVGTSTITGWIETPSIDFSGYGGNIKIKFDIARWPNDATTVRVFLNDSEIGEVLTPADNFQTVQISYTRAPDSGKIKIKGLTKRFFLDNLLISAESISTITPELFFRDPVINIYPIPASSELTLSNISGFDLIEILDLNGRILKKINPGNQNQIRILLNNFPDGLYIIRFKSQNKVSIKRFVKLISAQPL